VPLHQLDPIAKALMMWCRRDCAVTKECIEQSLLLTEEHDLFEAFLGHKARVPRANDLTAVFHVRVRLPGRLAYLGIARVCI